MFCVNNITTYAILYISASAGCTHGPFLIRRQRGHPGVALPLAIFYSANHKEGMQLESSPIRNEPNCK